MAQAADPPFGAWRQNTAVASSAVRLTCASTVQLAHPTREHHFLYSTYSLRSQQTRGRVAFEILGASKRVTKPSLRHAAPFQALCDREGDLLGPFARLAKLGSFRAGP